MSDDALKETTSSTEPPQPSLEERIKWLERQVAVLPQLAENCQRMWDRSAWIIKLEASRADHVVTLSGEIGKDRQARDRQTETLLIAIRELTEIKNHYATIVAGLEFFAKSGNGLPSGGIESTAESTQITETMTVDKRTGETAVTLQALRTAESAITAIRESNTGSHRLPTKEEIEEVEEKHYPWYAKIGREFLQASIPTKVLTLLLIGLILMGMVLLEQLEHHAPEPQQHGGAGASWTAPAH